MSFPGNKQELSTIAENAGDDRELQAFTSATLSKGANWLRTVSRTREQSCGYNLHFKVWMAWNQHCGWQAGATLRIGDWPTLGTPCCRVSSWPACR